MNKSTIELRPYQKECLEAIEKHESGRYLIQMATGLGKTLTFSRIPRKGRMLILSHRHELVKQPEAYFDCKMGFEVNKLHSDNEEIVSASVASLVNRLNRFNPDDFDIIIVDEAHHATKDSVYGKILSYFNPRLVLGFTATTNRTDNIRLSDIFDKIIFERNLKWGIKNKYLVPIESKKVNIGYSLDGITVNRHGDYVESQLGRVMVKTGRAIADAYRKYANGATIIFASSINHCYEIQDYIEDSAVVTGNTKARNRERILKDYEDGKIKCLINCNVFTEGTDLPNTETVIIARPTRSAMLYQQMIGRGLRLSEGKEHLTIIDCVGATERHQVCTYASLVGFDPDEKIKQKKNVAIKEDDDTEMPEFSVEAWLDSENIVNIFARHHGYNLHGMRTTLTKDFDIVVPLPNGEVKVIKHADENGNSSWNGRRMPIQAAIDNLFVFMTINYTHKRHLWLTSYMTNWVLQPASAKQLDRLKEIDRAAYDEVCGHQLTKKQVSDLIARAKAEADANAA